MLAECNPGALKQHWDKCVPLFEFQFSASGTNVSQFFLIKNLLFSLEISCKLLLFAWLAKQDNLFLVFFLKTYPALQRVKGGGVWRG